MRNLRKIIPSQKHMLQARRENPRKSNERHLVTFLFYLVKGNSFVRVTRKKEVNNCNEVINQKAIRYVLHSHTSYTQAWKSFAIRPRINESHVRRIDKRTKFFAQSEEISLRFSSSYMMLEFALFAPLFQDKTFNKILELITTPIIG